MTQATASSTHLFDADTAVTKVGDGLYQGAFTDNWTALGGTPNGGYMLAVCGQALRDHLPRPDPLVVSGFMLRPGRPGPLDLRVETARLGRTIAVGEVVLSQKDREVVRALGSFTDLGAAEGPTSLHNEPPALPDPDSCLDPTSGLKLPGVTIADRVEYRMPELPGWTTGEPGGKPVAEFWMRFTEPRRADPPALLMLVDAAAPAVLDLGATGSVTHELTVQVRGEPAEGWLACRASTRHLMGGVHEEDFEIWDSTGKLVAQSRQLATVPERR